MTANGALADQLKLRHSVQTHPSNESAPCLSAARGQPSILATLVLATQCNETSSENTDHGLEAAMQSS